MKYLKVLIGLSGLLTGLAAGIYYGRQKEIKAYEADIASLKEEYQKKIDEAKKAGRAEVIKQLDDGPDDGVAQKLKPNGDIDDIGHIEVVSESVALEHTFEDVVYFAKDKVWYNQDEEKTYNSNEPFAIPEDMFTYFGPDKADLLYLHNKNTETFYCVRYNPGSYVSNVLGYDDSSDE